jgi:hypothetical protein
MVGELREYRNLSGADQCSQGHLIIEGKVFDFRRGLRELRGARCEVRHRN